MLLDTSFIIHLEREISRSEIGTSHEFLQAHSKALFSVSIITVAELAEGYQPGQEQACWRSISRYAILNLSRDVAWQAGQISRHLRSIGQGIGDNDIWIAATALHNNMPLVTRNLKHFQRIRGLALMAY